MKIWSETLDDSKLIREYLNGNEESFEKLILKYLKPIYSFVYKNVGSQTDAEDITQEVFLKVWKNMRNFDLEKNFKPWLFQIAKNASIDFLRKKKSIPFSRFENEKGQNPLAENITAAPLNIVENLSDRKTVSLVFARLNNREQQLINMRHMEGLSFKEIAKKFQESINTVKSRYRRVVANIRKNMADLE